MVELRLPDSDPLEQIATRWATAATKMKLLASTIRYALLPVCIVSQISAQSGPTGLACVTDLTVPIYRGALWLSRASGDATAFVTVGPEGQPTSVEIRSEAPGLVGWLQSTMKAAR